MDGTTVIILIGVTIFVTYLFVRWREQQVTETYERFKFARKLGAALITLLLAWTFLSSGDPWLMGVAIAGLVFATTYWYVERPEEEVV